MKVSEIRKKYIDFFVKNNHAHIPSSSIIPENDPTTLFTGSGMQPLIPYLLGQKHPKGSRLVDSQKCFRAEDIDEVGDNRHTTFFEMLGNWSL
jgi:alanyl-tRNA synthetase